MNTRSLWISAAVGGAVSGFMSMTPGLNYLNCLLCLWVWVGGILAVYIYTQREKTSLTTSQGAIIGTLSGLIGALIMGGMMLFFGTAMLGLMSLSAVNELSADELLPMALVEGGMLLVMALVYLVAYPIFGALAGLIGVEMFGKSQSMPPGM